MSQPDFDAHLDLAKHAGAVTQQEIDDYVGEVPGAKNLKPVRKNFKAANYACIYGVGPPKLARETGLGVSQARTLIKAYWARNWAVERLCESVEVKRVDGEMWLFNPVSGFWYSLRNEKDIFSTLNQGTGVYCFDKWVMAFREKRNQLTAQFHDEVVLEIKKGNRERCEKLLKEAIRDVNNELKLNVDLDVDVQFGGNYAEIH
jgi:DNA polymerase I-like protein with 3'-5' exonuclease and polymerase domains